jgi:peptidoglycan/LPS O-acetylase OafA/YrhL
MPFGIRKFLVKVSRRLLRVEWLEHHTQGRDNNYNLIRLIAASAVIFGHSYRLSPMPALRDPVSWYIQGTWSGAIAVEAFFFISGLLVTASVIRSRTIARYFKARVLRLMPALLGCLLLSFFVLGPLLTDLSQLEYFTDSKTWKYLYGNASLVKPVFTIPGVFQDHPVKGVNGSLWTLPAEARMYLILGFAGVLGLMKRRWSANLLLAVLFSVGLFLPEYLPLVNDNHRYYRLAIYFGVGTFFFINREFIPLNWLALVILLGSMPWWHNHPYRLVILGATICYGVACIAYLPKWGWPKWMGDYSYGIYLYGWPSQQLAWLIIPGALPLQNASLAYLICFPLAVLSWHFLEKPALGLKNKNLLPSFLRLRSRPDVPKTA